MSLLPDKKWFIAETLLLYSIPARGNYLLHNNFVLTLAETPDAAATLAESRGREWEDTYVNTDGDTVITRFVGLRDLHQIYDELEDGAEILYEEHILSTEAQAFELVRPKVDFAVFRKSK